MHWPSTTSFVTNPLLQVSALAPVHYRGYVLREGAACRPELVEQALLAQVHSADTHSAWFKINWHPQKAALCYKVAYGTVIA